jgi:hypothetical protein
MYGRRQTIIKCKLRLKVTAAHSLASSSCDTHLKVAREHALRKSHKFYPATRTRHRKMNGVNCFDQQLYWLVVTLSHRPSMANSYAPLVAGRVLPWHTQLTATVVRQLSRSTAHNSQDFRTTSTHVLCVVA